MSAFSSRSANPPKISIETEYLTGNFSATKKLKIKIKRHSTNQEWTIFLDTKATLLSKIYDFLYPGLKFHYSTHINMNQGYQIVT